MQILKTEHVCEICEKPALQFTRDLREVETESGGTAWVSDAVHYRCSAHKRQPRVEHLDGKVEGGIDLVRGVVPSQIFERVEWDAD